MLIFLLACITPDNEQNKDDTGSENTTDSPVDSSGDSSGDSDSSPIEDAPTFVEDLVPVLDAKCAGCHYSQPEGLALYGEAAYDDLVNIPSGQLPSMDRVEPGDLQNSYLWRKLEDSHKAAGGSGDQMPNPYGEPLTSQELELFRTWIAGGAKR